MLDNGVPDHNDSVEAQLIFDRTWAAVKKFGKDEKFNFPVFGSLERELVEKLSGGHVDAIQQHWDTVAHTKKKEWTNAVFETWWELVCPEFPENTYQPVKNADDARFARRVTKWTESRDPSNMFTYSDSRVGTLAVKEFLANSEGKTYYPRCYGMPIEDDGSEELTPSPVTPSRAETQYVWVVMRNSDMQECRGSWMLDSVWADTDDVVKYFETREGVMGSSVTWPNGSRENLTDCYSNGWNAIRMELSDDAGQVFEEYQETLRIEALDKLSYDEFMALGLDELFPLYWDKK